jgi:hypothetical protein
MRVLALSLAAALSGMLASYPADAATVVGSVTRIKGEARGASEGKSRDLASGAPIHLEEVITTGSGGRLELTFDDGTRLNVGEKARVRIDSFIYRPGAQANAFRVNMTGAFRFVSGALGKTGESTMSVVTPFATIGIRGTDFWGGPIDGAYGVFLAEGAVSVETAGGETILDEPGDGMNIIVTPPLRGRAGSGGAVRGPVTTWDPDKVERALSTVSLN